MSKSRNSNTKTISDFAEHGDIEMVQACLDSGVSPDFNENSWKITPLMKAAENGHEDIIELLLERGADPNAKQTTWQNALIIAGERGQESIFKRLLEAGADPNSAKYKIKALSCMISPGKEYYVRLLLEYGAIPNTKDSKTVGNTALASAANQGLTEIVSLLLDAGVKPNYVCDRDAVRLAAESGHVDTVKVLLRSKIFGPDPIPSKGTNPISALHEVAKNGNYEIARILLDAGANPNYGNDGEFSSPLVFAVAYNNDEIAQLLIEWGADANINYVEGSYPRSPLGCAVENNNESLVIKLLGITENPNVLVPITNSHSHLNPLMICARDNNIKLATILLEHKNCCVNGVPSGELSMCWTPLVVAAKHGSVDVVKILLSKGAAINNHFHCDTWDYAYTALYHAIEEGHDEIASILLVSGADANTVEHDGKMAKEFMLEKGGTYSL